MDSIALTITLVFGLVFVSLLVWGYYSIPNWYVAKYRMRTKEEIDALKKAWVNSGKDSTTFRPPVTRVYSPGPNRVIAVQAGKVVTLAIMGSNLKMGSGNLTNMTNPDVFDFTNRKDEEGQNGGYRSWFAKWTNAWLKKITKYEHFASNLPDFFNPQMSLYEVDLERFDVIEIPNFDMKKRGSKWQKIPKPSDITREFRPLTYTRLAGVTEEIDSSMLMPALKGEEVEEVEQRIPFVVLYEFTGQLTNLVKLITKISGKFPEYITDLIEQAFLGAARKRPWDKLQNPETKKEICDAIAKEIGEQLKEIGFSAKEGEWSIQIKDYFVTDPDVRAALTEQGIVFAKGTAAVADAQFRKKVAGIDAEADVLRATGQAAFPQKRLEAIAEGGKAIKDVVRSHELTRDVLVADLHSQGVKEAKNGTIFVNAGGLGDRGPMPVIPFTSPSGEDDKGPGQGKEVTPRPSGSNDQHSDKRQGGAK